MPFNRKCKSLFPGRLSVADVTPYDVLDIGRVARLLKLLCIDESSEYGDNRPGYSGGSSRPSRGESRTEDSGEGAKDMDRATAADSSGDECGVKNGDVIRLCIVEDLPFDEPEDASFACIGDSPSDNIGDGTGSGTAGGSSGEHPGDVENIWKAESEDIALAFRSAGDVVGAIDGSISEENDG